MVVDLHQWPNIYQRSWLAPTQKMEHPANLDALVESCTELCHQKTNALTSEAHVLSVRSTYSNTGTGMAAS